MSYYKRFKYHFEPQRGWMNDPNGLVYFRGQYHAFFQHNPYSTEWDKMHWGHAISNDLLHWEELPIALYPDQEYENEGGCFSGSAIVKDDRLYLFYTSVADKQAQSVAYSDDGIHFTKYEGNPVICENPLGYYDFRDPKVSEIDGQYYMVTGSGNKDAGQVLLFKSENLLNWEFVGILFEGNEYKPCIECPDFFKLGDKYVLMFSKMEEPTRTTHFVIGDFENGRLVNTTICRPEWGQDFYAPQTMWDGKRRILIGWMYHWGKKAPLGCPFAGALSIPRELRLVDNAIYNYPVEEAQSLMTKESKYVKIANDEIVIHPKAHKKRTFLIPQIHSVDIFEDTKSVEIFINHGEISISEWINK